MQILTALRLSSLYFPSGRCRRTIEFGDFSKHLMENWILNIKVTNFYPESSDTIIFGKIPCQKVIELHYIAITFELLVQNQ